MWKKQYKEWTLTSNDYKIFCLKLDDPKEGVDSIWLTKEQLDDLEAMIGQKKEDGSED
jgi:5-bromo-4-chloroindolyl phosphate hydrolysis protein